MTQTTTTALVAGAVATVKPPQARGIAGVIVQNVSPYLLAIKYAGDEYSIPANTADLIDVSGSQPLLVTANNPDNAPNTIPANLEAIWCESDELPPDGSYPAALTPGYATFIAGAIEIITEGVPSTLLDVPIATADPIASGAVKTYDISGYASIYVSCTGNRLNLRQYDVVGNNVDDYDYSSHSPQAVRLAVVGSTLRVTNTISVGSSDVTIWGSNRTAQHRYDARFLDTTGDQWQAVGAAFAPGNSVNPGQLNAATLLQGACHATFRIIGDPIDGYFYIGTSALPNFPICDTAEMTVTATGDRVATMKAIALPAGGYTIGFFCAVTGGNATITVSILQDAY